MRALISVIQLAFSPISTCVRNFSPYAISIVKLGMQGHELTITTNIVFFFFFLFFFYLFFFFALADAC